VIKEVSLQFVIKIEAFMNNDSITSFLQFNTSRDYTQNNKNANGITKMKSYFGEETGKPRAIQFDKALANIKKINNKLDPGKSSKNKDSKVMKDKINEIVKKFKTEPKEEGKLRESRGRRNLCQRQFRTGGKGNPAEFEEVKSDIQANELRSPKFGASLSSTRSQQNDVSRLSEFKLYPFLKDKMIEFENYPLIREQNRLKKRSK
jgi:hypothetical protein